VFNRYLHFLRIVYLTLCEKSPDSPIRWAGRSIFGCVCCHIATPALFLIALTGGIRGLSANAIIGAFIAPMVVVVWWETKYIERSETLPAIWDQLRVQSAEERKRRWRAASWLLVGSYLAWLLSFGALFIRAFLEHRASVAGI
jgi:hypothetical protein